MENKLKFSTDELLKLNQSDLVFYIKSIQENLQSKLKSGLTIDEILDTEDPFESLEPILPQEIYPIMVLAMINDIKTNHVMSAILEGIEKGKEKYKSNLK